MTTEEGGGGGGTTNGNNNNNSSAPRSIAMDKDEKRMRREIANSNERRRMQSINAGFQSLRQMLPHHEGEKLSKVSVVFSCFVFEILTELVDQFLFLLTNVNPWRSLVGHN